MRSLVESRITSNARSHNAQLRFAQRIILAQGLWKKAAGC